MNVYGQLIRAQLETLSADPSSAAVGRVLWNTTDGRPKFDNGAAIRAFLTNDQKCIFGNDASAANNVRLNRAAAATLELLTGDAATAEGVSASASWAKLNAKLGGSLVDTYLDFTYGSAPANPAASTLRVYAKSDGTMNFRDNAGTEVRVNGSGAATFGQIASADGTGGISWVTQTVVGTNLLLNSDFGLWQRGVTTTAANGATAYQADRWYVKNSLGTNGILTFSRNSTGASPSLYSAQVRITTAPTAAQTNGCELYQTIENLDSRLLYGQTACFGLQVKALGNVNQVGVQFYYKTTEAKVDTAIGSEVTATVTSGAFALVKTEGQAIGTSMTTSGVVGVRIRITGVSSGNTYDLNNGFIVSQAMLNLGASLSPYSPRGIAAQEVSMCLRFYEKSYDLATDPGAVSGVGCNQYIGTKDGRWAASQAFKQVKRTTPTIALYSIATGTSARVRNTVDGSDQSSFTVDASGQSGFYVFAFNAGDADDRLAFQWTADAEI